MSELYAFLIGQERGDQDHERDEAGRNGFDSEDSGSFPSSNSNPGGRYVVFTTLKLMNLLLMLGLKFPA